MGAETITLYEVAAHIHPRRASGRFARLRIAAMLVLLGIFYLAPWIQVAGAPLVFLDLPHRRFHVFTLTLVPQELYLLSGLLLIAALTLFFFTSMAGRLWCGYACPQTVWTEAFLWIEHLVEGDRLDRIKLDRARWTARKLLRRGSKHALWLALGLYTGLTFVAYFVPARELFPAAFSLSLAGWPLFWSLFYGFATWGNAGFMREQVCKHMCPYARFQSAMFDRDTLVIGYDRARGEPRKSAAKRAGLAAADCVDCSLCVQVCPPGIDIRNGLQYECIACAACVDACDAVMDATGKPRGLIRYTSARQESEGGPLHWWRPRAMAYGAVWLAACAAFLSVLWLRTPLEFEVVRDRHALYRELPSGQVENLYTLRLENEGNAARVLSITATLDTGTPLAVEPAQLLLRPDESRALTVTARAPAGTHGVRVAHFRVTSPGDPDISMTRKASYLAGG
jgi:cytochrome c oxidase accessory protein FixG